MSALAWLFGLGALAIALPFLLHLIRRTPRGRTEFSSLMFLQATPPTLTRRSRLENIFLLLLRAAAICLIAAAFMRPFFRGSDKLSPADVSDRRVAILVDTSASMQRTGLWEQAKQRVDDVLDGLETGDSVCLLTFDRDVRMQVNFGDRDETTQRDNHDAIKAQLKTLEPNWNRGDLGQAMVSVAESLEQWNDSQRASYGADDAKLQIVVVSDLQKGTRLESLQAYQWPARVYVKFQPVVAADHTNATVQLLDDVSSDEDSDSRIRVVNSDLSSLDQFEVTWSSGQQDSNSDPLACYVPAGTSHVFKVPPEETIGTQMFTLMGDDEAFDNDFFVVPQQQEQLSIAYLASDDPDDPEAPQYYLRRALIESPRRVVRVRQINAGESLLDADPEGPTLVVIAGLIEENQKKEVEDYLNQGGAVLILLSSPELVEMTTTWTGGQLKDADLKSESRGSDYQMLAEIDFASQLFLPFANPRYNDFTKIRFWDHQSVTMTDEQSKVLARFENNDPAVWTRPHGEQGRVYCLASGWQPKQSQLALSTKFVPLIDGLVEIGANTTSLDESLLVGESILIPPAARESRTMVSPDGIRHQLTFEQTQFSETNQPGIYQLISTSNSSRSTPSSTGADLLARESETVDRRFAVNIDRAESNSAVIPVAQIESYDVKIGEQESAEMELAQLRKIRDQDLEQQQKVWKWLIVAAIGFLIFETWWAGRTSKMLDESSGNLTSGLTGGTN